MPVIRAKKVATFSDSVRVNVHVGYSQYQDLAAVIAILKDLKIRHVRDGGRFNISKLKQLGAEGIKTLYIMNPHNDGTVPNSTYAISKYNTSGVAIIDTTIAKWDAQKVITEMGMANLDGLEGLNEVDLAGNTAKYFWSEADKTKVSTDRASAYSWIKYQEKFAKDLWAAVKGNSATASLSVVSPSLGGTYTFDGKNPIPNQSTYTDFGNGHYYENGGNGFNDGASYIGINQYFANVVFPGNYANRNLAAATGGTDGNSDMYRQCYEIGYAPKPMYVTECGIHTGKDPYSISYAAHAKYIPRMFVEYFRLGFAATYPYELINMGSNADGEGGREESFGLYETDLSPKPAAVQLKAMMAIVGEATDNRSTADELDYTLTHVMPSGYTKTGLVDDVLLQKADGTFVLMVYHNIGIATVNKTGRSPSLSHPNVTTTLTLPRNFNIKNTTLRTDLVAPTATSVSNVSSYTFPVNDTVTILELTPVAVTPTPAPSAYTLAKVGTVATTTISVATSGNLQLTSSNAYGGLASDNLAYYSKAASSTVSTKISARVGATMVGGTEAWANAGIMLRETNDSNSKMVSIIVTRSQGLYIDQRTVKGGDSSNVYANATAVRPNYIQAIRNGSTLTISTSADGITWSTVYTTSSFSFATDYRIGYFVSSGNSAETVDVKFDYVNS